MPTTSWRITVNEIDKTQTVGTSPERTCATCIIAPKGPKEWKFYNKSSTQTILDLYGYPSSSYPAIQDALDVNKHSGLWLCAPYKSGLYGGVIVTSSGTIPFVGGTEDQEITSYSAVSCSGILFTGNGNKTVYSGSLTNYQYYNAESIDLYINNVSIDISTTISGNYEVLTSSEGDGLLNTTDGTLVFTFDTAPSSAEIISDMYTIDVNSIAYFTLFNYNQQADDLKVQVEANTTISGAFDITVTRYDPTAEDYLELTNSPYTVGLSTTSKDGNGSNIYIENIFDDDEQLFVATIQNEEITTFVDDTVAVLVSGGNRGSTLSGTDLTSYYDILLDTNKYSTNLIFDTTGDSAIASEFTSLRISDDLKYTSFALPTSNVSASDIIASPATYKNSVNNRGIFYYCLTWGLKTDIYQGNNFMCSNMGVIASQIMESIINDPSVQPMYFNENGNTGGQLDSGIIKFYKTATQSQLKSLDIAHFNPVVLDPIYGAWIVGARTTLNKESTWSYVAQSVETDLMIRDIITNVLTPQQGKANDDYHRGVAKTNTETIINNYIKGIDAYTVKCDRENNTDAILNQQKFILSVAVRFVAYAMTLTLNFINTPFGTDVEEAISG